MIEWQIDGSALHIMRDHPTLHDMAVVPLAWGVVPSKLPFIPSWVNMAYAFSQAQPTTTEAAFLAAHVAPLASTLSATVHDSYFCRDRG